jgi:3-polyprenyl-4-hydroxybenzoate decarboxylase
MNLTAKVRAEEVMLEGSLSEFMGQHTSEIPRPREEVNCIYMLESSIVHVKCN